MSKYFAKRIEILNQSICNLSLFISDIAYGRNLLIDTPFDSRCRGGILYYLSFLVSFSYFCSNLEKFNRIAHQKVLMMNSTNASSLNCTPPQYFTSVSDLFVCYRLLVSQNVFEAVWQIVLGIFTVIGCVIVVTLLFIKHNKTIFDIILIGHCKLIIIDII
jgi:hypothetical protein